MLGGVQLQVHGDVVNFRRVVGFGVTRRLCPVSSERFRAFQFEASMFSALTESKREKLNCTSNGDVTL